MTEAASMFLSRDELAELTGKTKPSAQIRWLTKRGYWHEVTDAGRPVVARAEVERHLVGPNETIKVVNMDPRLDLVEVDS